MRPSTSRSALPTQISTRHDWLSASSTASSTTSSIGLHLLAAPPARAADDDRARRTDAQRHPASR